MTRGRRSGASYEGSGAQDRTDPGPEDSASLGRLGGESRIHMVGIGGACMSAMAEVLAAWGADISGSDLKDSPALDRLRALGLRVGVGHRPENLGDARLVVRSRAVSEGNPEVRAARAAGLTLWWRTEALAELVAAKRGVAVSGTHGKSSTSAMLALILREAGADPSFIVGGMVTQLGANGHAGLGELMVVEADESDGTFLALPCDAGIATNVEPDHLDHFGDLGRLQADFARFVAGLTSVRVVCSDDPFLRTLPDAITYGSGPEARYRLASCEPSGFRSSVVIETPSGPLSFVLPMAGRHFAVNATGAAAVASELGCSPEAVEGALSRFRGVGRRFELKGEAGGVLVVDDYAHLPSEVAATVAAAGALAERVVAVFQPHRYSRTADLGLDFGPAFAGAGLVVVTDVFSAGEEPRPGITGHLVADAVGRALPGIRVLYLPERSGLAEQVAELCRPGDLVLTMGAGDVADLGDELVARLGGDVR